MPEPGPDSARPSVLYVTYTGILDPLGQSQILPYLLETRQDMSSLDIISFEKRRRLQEGAESQKRQLATRGIGWRHLVFSQATGRIGKAWDIAKMYAAVLLRAARGDLQVVHCRGYSTSRVGMLLQRLFGTSLIFDLRSFWADQRVDGGLWDLARSVDRWLFAHFKRLEKRLLDRCDRLIVLTHASLAEVEKISPGASRKATVIPCCADFDHFTILGKERRCQIRANIGVPEDALVLGYLGSLGTWYMLDEMLAFFALVRQDHPQARLLVISNDWNAAAVESAKRCGLADALPDIVVRPAGRAEVPDLLNACDVMLALYKVGFSTTSQSPTKFAEAAACGVPTICNRGVGDMGLLVEELDAGVLLDLADPGSMRAAAGKVEDIAAKGGEALRNRVRPALGLEVGAARYRQVYRDCAAMAANRGRLSASSPGGA